MKQAIVIGAGPAGLTCAYELFHTNSIKPIIIEQENFIGGISRTGMYKGNRIDIGGHRFFSRNQEILSMWNKILPFRMHPDNSTDNAFLIRNRKSRVFYRQNLFNYPLIPSVSMLQKLGICEVSRFLKDYLLAKSNPIVPEQTLEAFFINRFGTALYQAFFESYTEKVWGRHPSCIDPSWGTQRVKGLDLKKALIHTFFKDKYQETSLIQSFYYPKFGPGQLWGKMAEDISRNNNNAIHLNERVTRIDRNESGAIHTVYTKTADGIVHTYAADYVFSSTPISELFPILQDVRSTEAKLAMSLPYRDFITVGILANSVQAGGEDSPLDNWIYIQSPDVKVGRIQLYHNWSPYLLANPKTAWLGLEYFCSETDSFFEQSDEDMLSLAKQELAVLGFVKPESILDGTVIRVKKAYPAYFDSYSSFPRIRSALDKIPNLYCIGRNGQHRYNNMDHSMLTAIQAVKTVMGKASRESVWNVNTESKYGEER